MIKNTELKKRIEELGAVYDDKMFLMLSNDGLEDVVRLVNTLIAEEVEKGKRDLAGQVENWAVNNISVVDNINLGKFIAGCLSQPTTKLEKGK